MLDVETLEVPAGTTDQVAHMRGGLGRADSASLKRFPGRLEFRTHDPAGDKLVPVGLVITGGFIGLLPCTKLYKDADTEYLYCLLCP